VSRRLFLGCLMFALSTVAGRVEAAPILNLANGHYYDFIQSSVIWASALALADAATLDPDGPGGQDALDGYLLTITSQSEQDFLNANFGTAGGFWMAHTDQAVEGAWRYAAGPENGQLLVYENWAPGEPSNQFGDEHFAIGNSGAGGAWNDGFALAELSYVVEYSALDTQVPEPATLGLVAAGLVVVWRRSRLRRS